ncbi:Holliday junction branch migration protein RuvA [Desulfofundulus thermocisternus]|uniref:Holliday junction branch migration protein RuvA n=1 Tax=Desulfofundulus thermocisternus TaxID=42471 RepID=UPI0019DF4363|nr:Holliday junction branch migration protein RuvA [Desulfofundulus thermocisternus]MBE3586686.1 Holliday junction branch migration protein RuvA [Thermoanaerobacter sp.]MCS5694496.1 Holliday junction branch migration protein RuvA [Desulfofundulus thermocisternus]
MIAFLKGHLLEVQEDGIILDVNGVGYLVRVPLSMVSLLPPKGQPVQLYTHLVWREDGPALFGFSSRMELEAFRSLLNVAGVGPRAALAILSAVSPVTLRRAVLEENENILTAVPGIGKKTARRIILELKDKLAGLELEAGTGVGETALPPGGEEEAAAALVSLGYSQVEARRAVRQVSRQAAPGSVEDLLRLALQWLGRQKNA